MKKTFWTIAITLLVLSCNKQADKENAEQNSTKQSQTTDTLSNSTATTTIHDFELIALKNQLLILVFSLI